MNQPIRLFALIAGLALLAAGSCQACGRYDRGRICKANMKTLAGAIEMYDLDNGTRLAGDGARLLTSADQEKLVTGGYLQSALTDPGTQPATGSNYVLFLDDPRVACLVHGVVGQTGTAREQFVKAGVTEPTILAAALDEEPPEPPRSYPLDEVVLASIIALFNELALLALGSLGARTLARLGAWCNRLVAVLTLFESFGAHRVYFRPALLGTFLFMVLATIIGIAVLAALALRGGRLLSPMLAPDLQVKGGHS